MFKQSDFLRLIYWHFFFLISLYILTLMKLHELKRLSKSEKLLLVEELWDSIADDTKTPVLTRSQKNLLDEWLKKSEQSSARISWNEIKSNVKKRTSK
jgi:putative addiction module component (TIGR02574 family)